MYLAVGAAKQDFWGTPAERAAADEDSAAAITSVLGARGAVGRSRGADAMTVRTATPTDFSMAKIGESISGAAQKLTSLFGGKTSQTPTIKRLPDGKMAVVPQTAGFAGVSPIVLVAVAGAAVGLWFLMRKKG